MLGFFKFYDLYFMKIFEQLSDFWFQHLPILPEDYWR